MTYRALLLVDPDETVHTAVAGALGAEWRVSQVQTASDAIQAFAVMDPDCVVTELSLTDMPGMLFIEWIARRSTVPLLAYTGIADVEARILAIKMGADMVIIKPLEPLDFAARVEAVMRRRKYARRRRERMTAYGLIEVDNNSIEVIHDGRRAHLTPTDYLLLQVLGRQLGIIVTRTELLTEVWGYEADARTDHLLDVHIMRLRHKLEQIGAVGILRTRRGIGFSLELTGTGERGI